MFLYDFERKKIIKLAWILVLTNISVGLLCLGSIQTIELETMLAIRQAIVVIHRRIKCRIIIILKTRTRTVIRLSKYIYLKRLVMSGT